MLRILAYLLIVTFVTVARAEEIPQNVAVQIIVSEGADQGLKGMICIAEVLRRRGSVKGFYGYKRNMMKAESRFTWQMAARAWGISAHTHFTNGADHFENIRSFGAPWWAKYCVLTFEYKDHVFYKEIHQR